MTSKVINKIRLEVTAFKLHTVEYITNQEKYKSLVNAKTKDANKLNSYVDSCIMKLYEKSQCKIADFIHVRCQKDIEHVMPYLLSDDIKPSVLKMCCMISFRFAVDKIIDWCDANLIVVNIKKDIQNKLNHISKGEGNTVKEKNVCVSSVIASLRNEIVNIHSVSNSSLANYIEVLSAVTSLMKKEIGNSTMKLLLSLTVDLYIALIICYPEKYAEFDKCFVDIWSLLPKNSDLQYYYLSSQNIKFILAAKHFEITCEKFIAMLSLLIKNGLFEIDNLKNNIQRLNSLQWKDSKCNDILCLVLKTVANN